MKTPPLPRRDGLKNFTIIATCSLGLNILLRADNIHPPVEKVAAEKTGAPAKPASSMQQQVFQQIEKLRSHAVKTEPLDEALGGKTLDGTPITPRTPECFPAEARDLFWQMDMVPDADGSMRPLNFDANHDGKIDNTERNGIRGRNTWLLWGGGNETFWNWLAQDGYGITDFLVQLDSRNRGDRFKRAGLINQPGYQINADPSKRILGLYLDTPVDASKANSDLPEGYRSYGHVLSSPAWDKDAKRAERPADHGGFELFEPGDRALYEDTMRKLYAMGDGVDYSVYGFPSGIFGLRLFLNPDFFGVGDGPAEARKYWTERVENTHDRYYNDTSITQDPKLVRPFRVSVSCGFCHVGPHPLYAPKDPEAPDWANLSSNIGDQYWKPQPAFGNLQDANSFLFHFLASQQPGTVDTSLVSTDHINNANTINGVFDINPRLSRAATNAVELQNPANVLLPSIEDPDLPVKRDGKDWRHTPRVLLDGSDSIGAFGALARVYLNIGTFYEEWATCHNPIIGFKPQRPFSIEVCQRNSVYWQTNERYRVPYLAAYFTQKYAPKPAAQPASPPTPVATVSTEEKPASNTLVAPATQSHTSTQPMKLAAAREMDGKTQSVAAQKMLGLDTPEQRKHGREVWLNHCAICHSSKQPDGFALTFQRKLGNESWEKQQAPSDNTYVLPMDAADWDDFKRSEAYGQYLMRMRLLVEQDGKLEGDPLTDKHPFWIDNFLSNEIRVPVTLVGTNCGRAMATNGIATNVWDNFTSTTYKELPEVGPVSYFDPISGKQAVFHAPGNGRGYYRPATHISLWATAPFLHNNSMGLYLDNPSVKGRLVQFTDSIRRMLWSEKRPSRSLVLSDKELSWLNDVQKTGETGGAGSINDNDYIDPGIVVTRPGDLRGSGSQAASKDPGFIYRLPQDTSVEFPAAYAHEFVQGIAGPFITSLLEIWLWVGLVIWLLWLAWKRRPRYLGITLLLLAVLVAVGIALTGLSGSGNGSTIAVLLMGASGLLEFSSWEWWNLAIVLSILGVIFVQAKPDCDKTARWLLAAVLLAVVYLINKAVGWVPGLIALFLAWWIWHRVKPTLPGFSRYFFVTLALLTTILGYVANSFINGRALLTIPIANIKVGPLPIKAGPIPRGTPVNLVMSINPESPDFAKGLVSMVLAMAEIKKQGLTGEKAWQVFSSQAGQALIEASKCPDFVLDRGHLFGENLDPDPVKNEQAKEDLISFLKTL